MALSTFTMLGNHHHHLFPEHFYLPKHTLCLIKYRSLCSPWPPNPLLSVSMKLPLLGTSCKWNHTAFSLLYLAYFVYHVSKFLLIYLLLAELGPPCCVWAFCSCSEQGLPSSCGVWASHCDGFSCCRAQRCFSSGSTWAQWLWLSGSRVQAQ